MQDLRKCQRHERNRSRSIFWSVQRQRVCAQRGCCNQQAVESHPEQRPSREERLLRIAGRPIHHRGISGLQRQREGGERIRHQIEPEDLQGQQRHADTGQRGEEQHQNLGEVTGEEVEDELVNVVDDDATFFHSRGHCFKAVVLEHDGGRLFGHVRSP